MDIADMSATGRDEHMLAAYSNLTVARYFLHHADVPQVSSYHVCVRHELPPVLRFDAICKDTIVSRFLNLS